MSDFSIYLAREDRLGTFARSRASPWIATALLVTAAAAATLGIMVIIASTQPATFALGALKALNPVYGGLALLVGMTLGLPGAYLLKKSLRPPPLLERALADLSQLGDEIRTHTEAKLYYLHREKTIATSKQGLSKDSYIPLNRVDDVYQVKTYTLIGEGVSKKAYLEPKLPGGTPGVRAVELNPPSDREKLVLEKVANCHYVVHSSNIKDKCKGSKSKRTYFLEYYSQGTLEKNRHLSYPQACRVFADCLLGIVELSNLDLLHLDLHWENLLVTKDFGGRLADFGNAHAASELMTRPGIEQLIKDRFRDSFTGCPALIPPEIYDNVGCVLSGKEPKSFDPSKAEVWSIGCQLADYLYHKNEYSTPDFYKEIKAIRKKYSIKDVFNPFRLGGKKILEYTQELKEAHAQCEENTPLTMRTLLWDMCQPDPQQRLSAQEAATKLAAFIDTPSVGMM